MPWDMEEHVKGGVSVTIDSEGTQFVRSVKGNYVATYFWNSTIGEDCRLPEFVRHMLYEQRDAHRHCFRLHRSYRLGTLTGCQNGNIAKAYWNRYDWYEDAGMWFGERPRSRWRVGSVAKRVVVCNPSDYLPV